MEWNGVARTRVVQNVNHLPFSHSFLAINAWPSRKYARKLDAAYLSAFLAIDHPERNIGSSNIGSLERTADIQLSSQMETNQTTERRIIEERKRVDRSGE